MRNYAQLIKAHLNKQVLHLFFLALLLDMNKHNQEKQVDS